MQYSKKPAMKRSGRGVLDTGFRGYDDLACVTRRPTITGYFFFLASFAGGSGVSAWGSKPI